MAPMNCHNIIQFTFRIVEAEADGSPCAGCADPIYLDSRALEQKVYPPGAEWSRLFLYCASCADLTGGNDDP